MNNEAAKSGLGPNWKRTRRWSGGLQTPFERGFLVFVPADKQWFLDAPRGMEDDGPGDLWRLLNGGPDMEDAARVAAAKLWRRLERAGWFKLIRNGIGWDEEAQNAALEKLPRVSMPWYLLQSHDERMAAKGKARLTNLVRVGGKDIHHYVRRNTDYGFSPATQATLVVSEPGASAGPCSKESVLLSLKVDGMDALIGFLLDIRKGMSREESESVQATTKRTFEWQDGDKENLASRFERIQERAVRANDLMAWLMGADESVIDLVSVFQTMVSEGRTVAGLALIPEDGKPGLEILGNQLLAMLPGNDAATDKDGSLALH